LLCLRPHGGCFVLWGPARPFLRRSSIPNANSSNAAVCSSPPDSIPSPQDYGGVKNRRIRRPARTWNFPSVEAGPSRPPRHNSHRHLPNGAPNLIPRRLRNKIGTLGSPAKLRPSVVPARIPLRQFSNDNIKRLAMVFKYGRLGNDYSAKLLEFLRGHVVLH